MTGPLADRCTYDACCPLSWHRYCHTEPCRHDTDEADATPLGERPEFPTNLLPAPAPTSVWDPEDVEQLATIVTEYANATRTLVPFLQARLQEHDWYDHPSAPAPVLEELVQAFSPHLEESDGYAAAADYALRIVAGLWRDHPDYRPGYRT